jgi:hypothetical protein
MDLLLQVVRGDVLPANGLFWGRDGRFGLDAKKEFTQKGLHSPFELVHFSPWPSVGAPISAVLRARRPIHNEIPFFLRVQNINLRIA